MTYARSGQSIPIQLTAGQTLVVKELSGTSSVSGGSAQREAAGFIGAGFVIYGPQSTAATVTLTTTGECDWYVVNGDPQRRDIASLSGDMDQSGNVSKLYTPSGAQVGGGAAGLAAITNAAALKPICAALRGAVESEFWITATGDSLTQLGGDTITTPSSDVRAETYGYLARLRYHLNRMLGTQDGGQYIPAEAFTGDPRVTNSGGTVLNNFGPMIATHNASGVPTNRRPMAITAAGNSVTFSVTASYINLITWENTANNYNGTWSYAVDGGAATQVAGTGLTDTYRMTRIDLGSYGAHTVVIAWVSGQVAVVGGLTSNGSGIASARFGVGSTSVNNWTSLAEKVLRTSFKTLASPLHIIRFSYNDANRQTQPAHLTTPAVFRDGIAQLIAQAQANPANRAVLLMADPPTSTVFSPAPHSEYVDALRSLATGNVAFYDVERVVNADHAAGNTLGFYVDFVHRKPAGFDAEAAPLAAALLDPYLLTL